MITVQETVPPPPTENSILIGDPIDASGMTLRSDHDSVITPPHDTIESIPVIMPSEISADIVISPISPDTVASPSSEDTETVESTHIEMVSPLFDMNSQPEVSLSTEATILTNMGTPDTMEVIFHDTNEYIEHAISEVSELIATIDAADTTVLSAEEEHRHQKEHYAELEIADEAAHQKHLEERAHAEKMRKYLEKEQGKESGVINKKDE